MRGLPAPRRAGAGACGQLGSDAVHAGEDPGPVPNGSAQRAQRLQEAGRCATRATGSGAPPTRHLREEPEADLGEPGDADVYQRRAHRRPTRRGARPCSMRRGAYNEVLKTIPPTSSLAPASRACARHPRISSTSRSDPGRAPIRTRRWQASASPSRGAMALGAAAAGWWYARESPPHQGPSSSSHRRLSNRELAVYGDPARPCRRSTRWPPRV